MLIQAQHVFYFDFLLPEFENDNIQIDATIAYEKPQYRALILGWDRTDPLFHGAIGQTLASSELTVRPTWRPDGAVTIRARDTIVDRLTVCLEFDVAHYPLNRSTSPEFWLARAVRHANFVIEHIRVVTNSPSIKRIRKYWNPQHSNGPTLEIPYTVTWWDVNDDKPVPMYDQDTNSTMSSGIIKAGKAPTMTLQELGKSLAPGRRPPLPPTLLVDAEDALRALNTREATLAIASACEIAVNTYGKNQTFITASALKRTLSGRQLQFAERCYHEQTMLICGRSLQGEDQVAFSAIQGCYSERNHLMHEGKHSAAFDSKTENEQLSLVLSWHDAARRAVEWLSDLPVA